MSAGWSAQDEAKLEEMVQRRKASFGVLRGAVWAGLAPHLDNAEAEKLTDAVVTAVLREGRVVGPLFRTFDTAGEADGWKRVIMSEALYELTVALNARVEAANIPTTWEKSLWGVLLVACQMYAYFAAGADYCSVKPGGIVAPVYKDTPTGGR